MPCSPRSVDGRCHPDKVVYSIKGNRTEIPIGIKMDVRLPGKEISATFQNISPQDIPQFPGEVHVIMDSKTLTVSDIKGKTETTRFQFSIDPQGLKIVKEYDDLSVWAALYIGLNHDEIDINRFYQGLSRNGIFR